MKPLPEDGGPAFPHAGSNDYSYPPQDGMTLRDCFAGMALQGLLSCDLNGTKPAFARRAYEMADAMLAARGKEEA